MFKKTFFSLILSFSYLFGFNPAVLIEVPNDTPNQTSFVGLGYKAVDSFESLYNKKIPVFSSHGEKYDKTELLKNIAKKGYNPIISLGFLYSEPIKKASKDFPKTKFIIIEGNGGMRKNVLNINFKEEEGSFLVGAIAALKSKTNTIGFVGGMDIPIIRRFACGYIQGAKHINPDIEVLVKMTGDTYLAFNNPKKGEMITEEMIQKDADVIFHASDRTGKGVIKAAKDYGVFAIGVDANQNGEAPGTVLTSMVKRIDVAMYKVLIDALNNQLTTQDIRLGLKESALAWSLDKHNINLIDKKIQNIVDSLEFDIIENIIHIEDYIEKDKCSYYNFKASNDKK